VAVKRGDVVLLIMHGDIGKPRPGIVVQSNQLGEAATSILVCPISSDVREPGILRPIVEPDETNSLRVRSQIMTDKLAAVRRDRIRRTIGALDAQTLERVDRALLFVLGLTA
jgi:mRNA interferase MazF